MEKLNKINNTPYRLALDLGTSSIGVAVYFLDGNGNISNFEHSESYIFGEPVKAKDMVTTNTDRRSARLIRRQIARKAARMRKIGYIAQSLGVSAKNLADIKDEDVHRLRVEALSKKLTMPQFIKVLCHLVKNRGYKGIIDSKNVGKKLEQTSAMLAGGKTLGQILYERKNNAKGMAWRKVEEDGTFVYRDSVEREFELIWQEQSKYHPQLNARYKIVYTNMFPDFPGLEEISLKDAFHSALFYQQPIKWELEKVGSCDIYPEDKRACLSQIAYQNYRLAKEIANLRLHDAAIRAQYPLTLEQCDFLFNYISKSFSDYKKENAVVPFDKIYEKLNLTAQQRFTIDRRSGAKEGLKGNTTLYAFYKVGMLGEWEKLAEKSQELVLEFLNNITNLSDIEENDNNYIAKIFTDMTKNLKPSSAEREDGLKFILLLKENNIFSETDFMLENGRSSYGLCALKSITSEIKKGKEESKIIADIKPFSKEIRDKLRSVAMIIRQESINDPVISKALNELHRVMTYIVSKYGKPAEIVIELSRDIKNSLKRRQFLEGQNKIAAKERKAAISVLQEHSIHISPRNIEKYLLWEEQNHKCPYSGKEISIGQAFDEKQTQVDHIIPQRGEIGGPNVFENKVLVFTQENKDKNNRLPYEWNFKKDIDSYIELRSQNAAKKKKGEQKESFGNHSPLINFIEHLWLLYAKEKKGYYSQRERKWKATQKGARILRKINNLLIMPDQLKKDFSNRQNQETAWIGKIVLDWCKDICPKVTPSYGALTAYLRSQLKFDRILPLIRLEEGKILFDKDNKQIDIEKWKELFDSPDLSFEKSVALSKDFEKYCSEQENPPNTPEDKKRMFRSFCDEQRLMLQFNKRCDHRHHAVDAAVIGLCDFSLVQKASEHNAKYGTLHAIKYFDENGNRIRGKDIPGFVFDNIPQYADLKDEVRKRLTNYVVWHKPDHYPSGKLFDEMAYNIIPKNGEERFIKRKPLSSFIKDKPEQTIKDIERMVFGDTLKEEIIRQFKERLAQGLSQEEALCGRKDLPKDGIIYRGNKVEKVKYMYLVGAGIRTFDKNSDIKISSVDKMNISHHKGYQNGGYACMDFDAKTGKRINLIPLWKYCMQKEIPQGIIRVFAGDIVFNKNDKNFYKVQKFSARDGIQLCLTTEAVGKIISVSNFKNYLLVSSRQDIAKIKKEYV